MTIARLTAGLKKKLEEVRKSRNFKVEEWIDQKTDMLNDYMRKFGLKGCVVSVSGGVDSAVTIGLAMKAKEKPNSPIKKVLGIAQPIHSTSTIWKRAYDVCDALKAECITITQDTIFDQLNSTIEQAVGITGKHFSTGQLKSYMRTPVAYYVAQLLSQEGDPTIILGTGNWDEDGYLYYFCKAGDGISDVQLINDLHKSEVFKVGDALGVPQTILKAPPSADLWADQTDEDELGFEYDFVEMYTEYIRRFPTEEQKKAFLSDLSEDDVKYFHELESKALLVHRRNSHKEEYPINLNIYPTK